MRANLTALGVLIPAVGFLQLVPANVPENPRVRQERTIESRLIVPDSIAKTLYNACGDCHSNETKWPWYSRIAPMSWLVAEDVERGRAAMNFSEWPVRKGSAIGRLMAVCADVRGERMPPQSYRLMHPDARVTPDEAESLCAWTTQQSRTLSKPVRSLTLPK